MATNNLRKVVGCEFSHMRKKYRVPGMDDSMREESGELLGTDYGDYVSQAPLCSFLVRTGFLRAFMTRYERKSMLCSVPWKSAPIVSC